MTFLPPIPSASHAMKTENQTHDRRHTDVVMYSIKWLSKGLRHVASQD